MMYLNKKEISLSIKKGNNKTKDQELPNAIQDTMDNKL